MSFAANLNKLCKRAKDKAHIVVRKTAFELQGMMIDMSPLGNTFTGKLVKYKPCFRRLVWRSKLAMFSAS